MGDWLGLGVSVVALVVAVLSALSARRAALSAERSLRRTLAAAERAEAVRRTVADVVDRPARGPRGRTTP